MIKSLKSILTLVSLAVLLGAVTPAYAEDNPLFIVIGSGQKKCGDFVAAAEGVPVGKEKFNKTSDGSEFWGEHARFLDWATGFISGLNLSNPAHQIEDTTHGSFDLWLRNYCTDHPTLKFIFAVTAFFESEKKK